MYMLNSGSETSTIIEVTERCTLICSLEHFLIILCVWAGFGAAVCLFNKVTKRAQAEMLRRMSRFCKTLNHSLGLVDAQQAPQPPSLPAVLSSPLRFRFSQPTLYGIPTYLSLALVLWIRTCSDPHFFWPEPDPD